jgi:hypothetical protein
MDNYPFKAKAPVMIRAMLYDYDFTRLNTSWSRDNPYVEILPLTGNDLFTSLSYQANKLLNSLWNSSTHETLSEEALLNYPWWYRRNPREYIPPLERNNPSLTNFLQSNRLDVTKKDLSYDTQYNQCMMSNTFCPKGTSVIPFQ